MADITPRIDFPQELSGLFDLNGKVAYVPGGYGGIGEAIAWSLALAGAKVAVSGRDEAKAAALARALQRGGPRGHRPGHGRALGRQHPGVGRRRGAALGRPRHPGQLRRHAARAGPARRDRGNLRRSAAGQPQGRHVPRAGGGAAPDRRRARRRADPPAVGARAARPARPRLLGLLQHQGWPRDADPPARQRTGACTASPSTASRRRWCAPRWRGTGWRIRKRKRKSWAASRWAVWPIPRTWPVRPSSSPARPHPSSPGRCSTSTAASPPVVGLSCRTRPHPCSRAEARGKVVSGQAAAHRRRSVLRTDSLGLLISWRVAQRSRALARNGVRRSFPRRGRARLRAPTFRTAHSERHRGVPRPLSMLGRVAEAGAGETPMFLKNCWYVAAWDHELIDGKLLPRTLLEERVLLYKGESGKVVALKDRCCHRGAPLSLGRLRRRLRPLHVPRPQVRSHGQVHTDPRPGQHPRQAGRAQLPGGGARPPGLDLDGRARRWPTRTTSWTSPTCAIRNGKASRATCTTTPTTC